MKTKTKVIDKQTSIYLRYLHQEGGVSKAELARRYPQHATRSIYRHATKDINEKPDKRKHNRGRPKKLSDRDERVIINTMKNLRTNVASFTAKKIQEEANVTNVSTKTIHRVLHKNGYHYLHSRKKGLVTQKDKIKRLKWAKSVNLLGKDFWRENISFYLDGVGFGHKTNPFSEAQH